MVTWPVSPQLLGPPHPPSLVNPTLLTPVTASRSRLISEGVGSDSSLLSFLLTDNGKLRYDLLPQGQFEKTIEDLRNITQSMFEKELMPLEKLWRSDKKKLESRVKELEGLLGESERKNERFEMQAALLKVKLKNIHEARAKMGELDKEVKALPFDEGKGTKTGSRVGEAVHDVCLIHMSLAPVAQICSASSSYSLNLSVMFHCRMPPFDVIDISKIAHHVLQ